MNPCSQGPAMKLREHPLMIRKSGFCSWPPVWKTPHLDKDEKPIGEVGVLEDVAMSNLIDNKVFLFMRFQGYRYMGVVAFDDLAFCHAVFTLLKANRDLSLEQVGDLDVSFTL